MRKFRDTLDTILMKKLLAILFIILISLNACTKSDSDDDSPDLGDTTFDTDCGTIFEGKLVQPIEANKGKQGIVEVIGSNLVIFRRDDSEILVKLQGLDVTGGSRESRAVQFLRNLSGNNQAVFFQADESCTTTVSGGGIAAVGHLFTLNGLSFSEELIKAGLAKINRNDVCSGVLIGPCYIALQESNAPVGASISNFIWKPKSERDGNLVVLLNPGSATVVVNGETLVNSGASNGRGTTARSLKPGAAFGTNIEVEVFDSQGNNLRFPGGATVFIIPDGAQRVEF